jgi:protein TonB
MLRTCPRPPADPATPLPRADVPLRAARSQPADARPWRRPALASAFVHALALGLAWHFAHPVASAPPPMVRVSLAFPVVADEVPPSLEPPPAEMTWEATRRPPALEAEPARDAPLELEPPLEARPEADVDPRPPWPALSVSLAVPARPAPRLRPPPPQAPSEPAPAALAVQPPPRAPPRPAAARPRPRRPAARAAPLVVLYAPDPRGFYPPEALRRGIAGAVRVELVVAAAGHVEQVRVVGSSGRADLDEAALALARTYRFAPGDGPRRTRVLVEFRP